MKADDIKELSSTDLAWAAGIIDGEGCVRLSRTSQRKGIDRSSYVIWVGVGNTDVRMLNRLSGMFGGNVYPNDRKGTFKHNRMMWQWCRSGAVARAMLEAIRPYLVCKGDQVDVLLTYRPGKPGLRVSPEVLAERELIITRLAIMKKGA